VRLAVVDMAGVVVEEVDECDEREGCVLVDCRFGGCGVGWARWGILHGGLGGGLTGLAWML
jgi:hypothetical protein